MRSDVNQSPKKVNCRTDVHLKAPQERRLRSGQIKGARLRPVKSEQTYQKMEGYNMGSSWGSVLPATLDLTRTSLGLE